MAAPGNLARILADSIAFRPLAGSGNNATFGFRYLPDDSATHTARSPDDTDLHIRHVKSLPLLAGTIHRSSPKSKPRIFWKTFTEKARADDINR